MNEQKNKTKFALLHSKIKNASVGLMKNEFKKLANTARF